MSCVAVTPLCWFIGTSRQVFCSPFDEALAQSGPAAVFLLGRKGTLRLNENWSRDVWERAPGPHEHGFCWIAFRDHGTGWVQLLLVTSPTLLQEHPKGDVCSFETREEAEAFIAGFGQPPLCKDPWS